MLRIALLVAVLANLLFFVWSQGYFGGGDNGREPQRLAAQVAPERLRIVSPAETPAPTVEKPVEKAAEVPTLCKRLHGLGADVADALVATFRDKLPGIAASSTITDTPPRILVAITGLVNKDAANTKLAQVKAFGIVTPLTLEEEGGGSYRLVFSEFPARPVADQYLAGLAKRGLKTPRIVELPSPGKVAVVELRGPEAAFAPLASLLESHKGATIEDCSPATAAKVQ